VRPAQRPMSACSTSTTAREHGAEVLEVVSILSGGDFERKRVTQCSQAVEIVGRYGLLEPRDTEFLCVKIPSRSACFRPYAPLASTNSSASSPMAFRAARTRLRSASHEEPRILPNLHLDARDALFHPPGQLGATDHARCTS